jgi:hypothetical protein
MASTISAGTSAGTAIAIAGDTTGNLAFTTQAGTYTQTVPNVTGTVMVSGNMPAFAANVAVGKQTVSNNTVTKVQFSVESFDTGGCFNNTGSTVTLNGISTPSYCFAPNVAGYYWLSFTSSNAPINGETYCYVVKNSSGALGYDIQTSATFSLTANNFVYANGTSDYFFIQVVQGSGGNIDYDSNTRFAGYLVRTA